MSSGRLRDALEHLKPDNQHPLPWSEAWDGSAFTVDLAYRSDDIDIDTSATSKDIYSARRHAFSNLLRLLTKQ